MHGRRESLVCPRLLGDPNWNKGVVMFIKILTLVALYLAFIGTSLSAERTWYPKGEDRCANYLLDRIDTKAKLVTPVKDPVIANLVNNFKVASKNEDSGEAMLFFSLFTYCNTHALTKLGDISAQDLLTNITPPVIANANSSNTSTPDDSHKTASTPNALSDAMMTCLQNTLRNSIESCRRNNCPVETLSAAVRAAQQAACGYSAIEPAQPINMLPSFPTSSNCTSKPMHGGGFTTECTQY